MYCFVEIPFLYFVWKLKKAENSADFYSLVLDKNHHVIRNTFYACICIIDEL